MDELLIALINMVLGCGISTIPEIGQLPKTGGIVFQYAPGTTKRTWLSKGTEKDIFVPVLAKNSDQQQALEDVSLIGECLELRYTYDQPENNIELVNVLVSTTPNYIGKEDNGQFIYGIILTVKIST